MSRNLKALGLALVAALALGAIGAQGASAVVEHSFRSAVNSTVLTGSNAGETSPASHTFRAGTGGPTVHCTIATFSGTNTESIRDTVTVHPKYESCTAFGANTIVDTDGCNYILDSDTTSGGHFSGEHATASVECEAGHDITVTSPCKITFKGNTVNQNIHGIAYTAVTHSSKESITVTATAGSIHYETTDSGGIACELIGRADGTYTSGIYEGKVSVTGYEDSTHLSGSTTAGTTWNHSAQVNISISTPT